MKLNIIFLKKLVGFSGKMGGREIPLFQSVPIQLNSNSRPCLCDYFGSIKLALNLFNLINIFVYAIRIAT